MILTYRLARIVHAASKEPNDFGLEHVALQVVNGKSCLCATDGKQAICLPVEMEDGDNLSIIHRGVFAHALSILNDPDDDGLWRDDEDDEAYRVKVVVGKESTTIDGIVFPNPKAAFPNVGSVMRGFDESKTIIVHTRVLRPIIEAIGDGPIYMNVEIGKAIAFQDRSGIGFFGQMMPMSLRDDGTYNQTPPTGLGPVTGL